MITGRNMRPEAIRLLSEVLELLKLLLDQALALLLELFLGHVLEQGFQSLVEELVDTVLEVHRIALGLHDQAPSYRAGRAPHRGRDYVPELLNGA